MSDVEIVTQQAALEAHGHRWREAGCFAFDTEFIRDDTYDSNLCLIQVAADGQVVLIDPTDGLDVSVFWGLVTDEAVPPHCARPPRFLRRFQIAQRGLPPRNDIVQNPRARRCLAPGFPPCHCEEGTGSTHREPTK